MSSPVLATKLFPPARRRALIARPRLTELLDGALEAGGRLTLVSAPAGFGKTTVLSDWLDHLGRREAQIRVGWLSLDEGDNDLGRLMAHLLALFNRIGLGVDPSVVESMDTAAPTPALTAVINEITRTGELAPDETWVVVLDDYHVLEAPNVNDAIAFLLDHCPDRLHLVIATRSDPRLPLARMRSGSRLTELRAADLRFTAPEASAFLNQVMGLSLTPADVAALEERTEGWIAGLQLAALSLRGIEERDDVAGFIDAFTGSNRFVIDYLADEVLARQPDRVRRFLLDTALLDRLTGPLCDAVTGRSDGARMLEELERGNLFVVPLDANREAYRYHHLFADVLRARLRAEDPERMPRLHRVASDWYAERGLLADAVGHALAGRDFDRAAYLMEQALPETRRTRQDGLLLTWVRSLPEQTVRSRPVLGILSAWSFLMSGDLDAVEARLDDAEAALAAAARHPVTAAAWADTEDLRTAPANIAVYRASLAQARGDVAGTVHHARDALQLAGPGDHFLRGAGAGFLGLAQWAAGEVVEARSTFAAAVQSLYAAGNQVDALDSTVSLADLWLVSGQPSRARRLCEQAMQKAGGDQFARAAAALHVALAELDTEMDDLTSAEAHLDAARTMSERMSITGNRYRWFVATARVHAARGEHGIAESLLDKAAFLYRSGFYPEVRPIHATKARLQVGAGDLTAAAGWAEDHGISVDDAADYLHEYEQLTLARLLVARRRVEPPGSQSRDGCSEVALDGVVRLLDRLEAAASAAGREGSVLEIRVLQALTHHARGDLPAALVAVSRALGEGPEPDGHVRLYLDEGAPMIDLLTHAATTGDEVVRWRAGRLLARASRMEHVGPSRTAAATSVSEALSQRELEVLRLLDSELTGPEIARHLFVTVNTLRTHTKRIFTKLGVRTRAAAVARARERGLL